MKYYFVFLGDSSELSRYSYSDLMQMDNAIYVPGLYSQLNKFQYLFFRLHTINFLKKYISVPFKSLWAKAIFKKIPIEAKKDETFVYVCQREYIDYEQELHLVDYIKSKNPRAKFVVFFEDLFKTYHNHDYGNTNLKLEFIKGKYDLAISFDQGDCEKYGFVYHPLVFSSFKEELNSLPSSDAYFLGLAKNRFEEIIKTFERLSARGLKCDFHIAGVRPEDRIYVNEIDYEPNISYMDNLQHVAHTKCIVEIMQKGGKGFSQRALEAIGLGKMLLTNNENISVAPFYNPSFIKTFSNPSEITDEIIKEIKDTPDDVNYNYREKISPIEFVRFIIAHLSSES